MKTYGRIVIIKRSGQDGTSFPLVTDSCIIGRDKDCDIRIQLPSVSAQHCSLDVQDNGQIYLKQLSTSSVTLLNGIILKQERLVHHKDIVTVVDRCFRFEYPTGSEYRTSVSPGLSWSNDSGRTPKLLPPSSAGRTPRPQFIGKSLLAEVSPRKSPNKVISPRQLRLSRKSVSFGPILSPEQFNDELPPSTPIKRGRQPPNRISSPFVNSTKVFRLSVPGPKHATIEESPKLAKKHKLSPDTAAVAISPLPNGPKGTPPSIGKRKSPNSSLSLTPLNGKKRSPNRVSPDSFYSVFSTLTKSKSGIQKRKSLPKVLGSKIKRKLKSRLSLQPPANSKLSDSWSSLSSDNSQLTLRRSSSKSVLPTKDSPSSPAVSPKRTFGRPSMRKSLSKGRRSTGTTSKETSFSSLTLSPKVSRSPRLKTTPSSPRRRSGKSVSPPKKDSATKTPVLKIIAPSSPDSKKSKALITIHASKLRSQMKKAPKSLRKPLFSETLKSGLMKNPRKSARKKKAAKKLIPLVIKKKPPIKRRTPKTPASRRKKRVESTGHANSPKTIVVQKNPVAVSKTRSSSKSFSKERISSSFFEISSFKTPNITRDTFISPLNTPGLMSVQKSAIMKQFLEDADRRVNSRRHSSMATRVSGSASPSPILEKSPRHSRSRLSTNVDGDAKNLLFRETPTADYTDVMGVKRLFKTPQTSPKADFTNIRGLKRLFAAGSPKADYSNVYGLRNLFRSPNKSPKADYNDVFGLKRLLRSPRASPTADYTNVHGLKRLLRSHQSSPLADYGNVSDMRKLLMTPKNFSEIDYAGMEELFASPPVRTRQGSVTKKSLSPGESSKQNNKRQHAQALTENSPSKSSPLFQKSRGNAKKSTKAHVVSPSKTSGSSPRKSVSPEKMKGSPPKGRTTRGRAKKTKTSPLKMTPVIKRARRKVKVEVKSPDEDLENNSVGGSPRSKSIFVVSTEKASPQSVENELTPPRPKAKTRAIRGKFKKAVSPTKSSPGTVNSPARKVALKVSGKASKRGKREIPILAPSSPYRSPLRTRNTAHVEEETDENEVILVNEVMPKKPGRPSKRGERAAQVSKQSPLLSKNQSEAEFEDEVETPVRELRGRKPALRSRQQNKENAQGSPVKPSSPKQGRRGTKLAQKEVANLSPVRSPPKATTRTRASPKEKGRKRQVDSDADTAPSKKAKPTKKAASKKIVSKAIQKIARTSIQPTLSPVPELSESNNESTAEAATLKRTGRTRGKANAKTTAPSPPPKRITRSKRK